MTTYVTLFKFSDHKIDAIKTIPRLMEKAIKNYGDNKKKLLLSAE